MGEMWAVLGALATDQTEFSWATYHLVPLLTGLDCPGIWVSLVVAAEHPTLGKWGVCHLFLMI